MSDDLNDEDRILAARIMYEGTHGLTMADLSERTGIPKRTLSMYSREQGWRKQTTVRRGETTDDALKASEIIKSTMGKQTVISEEAGKAAELVAAPVPNEADQLLERHRKEWTVPRALSAEAMRHRDTNPIKAFEFAKLAKITAETMKIMQDGERKAHGLDKPDSGGSVVVIERG